MARDGNDDTTAFDRWYEREGDKLNESRRSRYQSDPEYRKRAIERSREYRRNGPKNGPRKEYRLQNGKKIRVYRISEAAKKAKTNPTAIRRWETAGVIPDVRESEFNGSNSIRYYTTDQIKIIREVAKRLRGVRPTDPKVDEVRKFVHEQWEE